MHDDPLSDILNLVGVKSSVYFLKDFSKPWCMSVANTGFAQFHFIVRGNAIITHDTQAVQVSAGDIVLFPKGASHSIGDAAESHPINGQELIASMERGVEPFIDGEFATQMVCGHFEYDFNYAHPLFENLPSMILLSKTQLPEKDHLFGLLTLIIQESKSHAPGSSVVVRRLSESLLVTILRGYFKLMAGQTGFHQGLENKKISRAIVAIHSDVNNQFTVDQMAELAGMSRSSFLHHFKRLMGQSAGAYATRWKLLKARSKLSETKASVESIALSAGYNSATAFSRAFLAHFGETPSQFRLQAEDS